jgi:hypothetical protein
LELVQPLYTTQALEDLARKLGQFDDDKALERFRRRPILDPRFWPATGFVVLTVWALGAAVLR